MQSDLFDDLARLGASLTDEMVPINAAEVIGRTSRTSDDDDAPSAAATADVVVVPLHRPHTTRSPRWLRSAAVGLAAAAIAGVVWVSVDRRGDQPGQTPVDGPVTVATDVPTTEPTDVATTEPTSVVETPSTEAPVVDPTTSVPTGPGLQPSATPGVIDAFPVLDPSDLPAADSDIVIVGGWTQTVGDSGWMGLVGVAATGPDRAPTSLTRVQAMPVALPYTPPSVPGRRDGIREGVPFDGRSSLFWEAGPIRFVLTGPDIELMYDLVDRVQAIEPNAGRGGYEFVGDLPPCIVELDPPRRQTAGWIPGIYDSREAERLSLYVDDQSPLQTMIDTGGDVRPVTVNGHPGYISSRNGSVVGLAFAIASDETVQISISPYSESELLAIAERIQFVDEATWRDHYDVRWGNGLGDPPTGTGGG